MKTFIIEVSDKKGEYPSKVYHVEADEEFLAYGSATDQFIVDNGHRQRRPTERISSYLSRFWNKAIPADQA